MNITASLRLGFLLFLALARVGSAQTLREQLKQPDFKLYCVTIGADSKLQAFDVSRVIDPKSRTTDPVDVPVPAACIAAAKKKTETKHFPPKLQDGKPVAVFSYFFYTPSQPETVITDLDQALDKQP